MNKRELESGIFGPLHAKRDTPIQPIISPYALEDPMYDYMQEKAAKNKQERINQLKALLNSSSDSDSSTGKKSKKKKKKKKGKDKKKTESKSPKKNRHSSSTAELNLNKSKDKSPDRHNKNEKKSHSYKKDAKLRRDTDHNEKHSKKRTFSERGRSPERDLPSRGHERRSSNYDDKMHRDQKGNSHRDKSPSSKKHKRSYSESMIRRR